MSEELLRGRLLDLAKRSYNSGIYTFSGFLSMADISVYLEMSRELSFVPSMAFGGGEDCERKMVRFGSEETLGYEVEFPIAVLKISPLIPKFSEPLSHRDFLGALMNLGIERDKMGDVLVRENEAFLYCEDSLSEFICENLTRVRHTSVLTKRIESPEDMPKTIKQEESINVASERIDAVIAKLYNLSRNESAQLFIEGKVYVNGRLMENESRKLAAGDVISVRGFGKFEFAELGGLSKKGRLYVKVKRYV